MATSLVTYEALLKELYPNDKVEDLACRDKPLMAMLPKYGKFTGESMKVPVHYGNTNKRSATLATAISNSGTSKTTKFDISRAKDYAVASLDRETIKASEGNEGAFVEHFKFEVDDAINALSLSMAHALYRDGTGVVGQISSGSNVSSSSVTLATVSDAINLQVGQEIQLSSNAAGTSLRNTGATATITAVNPVTGVLSFAGALTSEIAAAQAGDYVIVSGDAAAKAKGLAAWLPATDPDSTSFFGCDRSVDPVRLGGNRVTPVGTSVQEDIIGLANRIATFGGRPDTCFLPFSKWDQLVKELQSSVRYVDVKAGKLEIPFSAIVLAGPSGQIKCVPDSFCPDNRIYMLQMDTWKLATLGAAPGIMDDDGAMIREATADAYQIRLGSYFQLYCNAPGYNGVLVYS